MIVNYVYAKFYENSNKRLACSRMYTYTHTQTNCENHFFGLSGPQGPQETQNLKINFFHDHQTFTLYYVYMSVIKKYLLQVPTQVFIQLAMVGNLQINTPNC